VEQKLGVEEKIARVISYVFHPLVMPLVSLFIIFQLQTLSILVIPESARWLMLGMVLLSTIAFPLLVVMLLMRKGIVQSVHMETREERLYPYLVVCIVYYILYLLFSGIDIPVLVTNFILGVSVLLLLVLILNFRWKISMHTVAVGGMTGAFIAIAIRYQINVLWIITTLTFISGLVGYARLRLNAHSGPEIYLGWLIGAAVMPLVMLVF
jgi:hypothetical protein